MDWTDNARTSSGHVSAQQERRKRRTRKQCSWTVPPRAENLDGREKAVGWWRGAALPLPPSVLPQVVCGEAVLVEAGTATACHRRWHKPPCETRNNPIQRPGPWVAQCRWLACCCRSRAARTQVRPDCSRRRLGEKFTSPRLSAAFYSAYSGPGADGPVRCATNIPLLPSPHTPPIPCPGLPWTATAALSLSSLRRSASRRSLLIASRPLLPTTAMAFMLRRRAAAQAQAHAFALASPTPALARAQATVPAAVRLAGARRAYSTPSRKANATAAAAPKQRIEYVHFFSLTGRCAACFALQSPFIPLPTPSYILTYPHLSGPIFQRVYAPDTCTLLPSPCP